MPAVRLKTADSIAAKFVTRASAAAPEYASGVRTPRRSQSQAAIDAAPAWGAGLQQAIADNRFVKGLEESGDSRWMARSSGVGAQRYPQGVADARVAYAQGFQPYLETLNSLDLTPRGPKGDPANLNRVAQVARALRATRLGQ